jgi:hypothetical protein
MMSSIDVVGIFESLQSHAMSLGLFQRVQGAESKSAPPNSLSVDFFVGPLRPLPEASGLASTSVMLTVYARIYLSANIQPADYMDPHIMEAAADLIQAYNGDFDLGATVRNLDLLGEYSEGGVYAEPGYIEIDGTKYRVVLVTIPVVINDAWGQA